MILPVDAEKIKHFFELQLGKIKTINQHQNKKYAQIAYLPSTVDMLFEAQDLSALRSIPAIWSSSEGMYAIYSVKKSHQNAH
jgi:hypothetical protein